MVLQVNRLGQVVRKSIFELALKVTNSLGPSQGNVFSEVKLADDSQYKAVLGGINDAIVTFGTDCVISSANPAADILFGQQVIGKMAGNLWPQEDWTNVTKREWGVAIPRTFVYGLETKAVYKDGSLFDVEIKVSQIENNGTPSYIAICADISARRKVQEELVFKANHDSLTKLYNRAYFEDILTQRIASAQRSESELFLLFLDIDHFKKINDTYGHWHGDEALRVFSSRIRASIRGEDVFARLGGDEFVILPSSPSSIKKILKISSKIQNCLVDKIPIGENSISLQTSIGIAQFPQDGKDMKSLIQAADSAMYQAKSSQRGVFVYEAK